MVENIAGVRAPLRELSTIISTLPPVSYTSRAPLAKVLLFYAKKPRFREAGSVGFEP